MMLMALIALYVRTYVRMYSESVMEQDSHTVAD